MSLHSSCDLKPENYPLFKKDESDYSHPSSVSKRKLLLGYMASFCFVLVNSIGVAFAQFLGGYIPDFELNVTRFGAQLTLILPVCVLRPERMAAAGRLQSDGGWTWARIGWLVLMCILHSTGNIAYYAAAVQLPVGTFGCLRISLVIIILSTINMCKTTERKVSTQIACVLCVAGIILVMQPPVLFNQDDPISRNTNYTSPCSETNRRMQAVRQTQNSELIFTHMPTKQTSSNNPDIKTTVNSSQEDAQPNMAPESIVAERAFSMENDESTTIKCYLMTVFSACCFVGISLITHHVLCQVDFLHLTLWTAVSGLVIATLGMVALETPVIPTAPICLLFWCGHAFSGGISTLSYQYSLQIVPPVLVSIILSLEAVPLFLWQYTVLRHIHGGYANWLEVLGALLVLAGNATGPAYQLHSKLTSETISKDDELATTR